MVKISQSHVSNWIIVLPSIDEQTEIVSQIKRIRTRIKDTRFNLSESIALLKERRSALITAAVTGQISPEEMVA
jgi:type I restriction enzyme S subunit